MVAAFAGDYPRYLAGQLPARRLPELSPAAWADLPRVAPRSARQRAVHLRATAVEHRGDGWTVLYTGVLSHQHTTLTATVTAARIGGGWQITGFTPPDVDQLTARHPAPPRVPAPVQRAAVTFTDSYLAYTYGHAPAARLARLTLRLRRQLTARPPVVPAAIRVLHPRILSLALARTATRRWRATAQITDGPNTYTIHTTLTPAPRGWTVARVTAGN